MNALKNLFSAIKSKVPAGGAGGAPKLPGAGAAVGAIVTFGTLGGIGYGAYHSMVTGE